MQVQKVIERLGYKANEAKVYLAALGLGESTVSDIAAKLKLPRTSVQIIVDKLHKDDLVNFYTRRRFKYWVAERPDHLLQKLREREGELQAALPQLEKLRHGKEEKPHIKTYEGVDEIRHIYDDMLETKQPISGIIPWDEWIALLGRNFMEDFIEKRVRHFLRMRLLIPKTDVAMELRSRDGKELRETRYLPPDIPVSSTMLIYGTKAVIVSLNKKLPTAVMIEDREIRDTNSALFEEIWERSGQQAGVQSGGPLRGEGLFRILADSSPQPLLIANEKVEIEYVNQAWEKEFGYSIAEVHGENPRLLQSGKTPRAVYGRMWKALDAGKAFQSANIVNKRKDGTLRNLHTSIFPVRQHGKLYYVQILDDITKRKQMEEFTKNFMRSAAEDIRPHLKSIRQLIVKEEHGGISSAVKNELSQLDDIVKQLFASSQI